MSKDLDDHVLKFDPVYASNEALALLEIARQLANVANEIRRANKPPKEQML